MLYLLIAILIKRSGRFNHARTVLLKKINTPLLKTVVLFSVLCGCTLLLCAQELRYNIVKGGEKIGILELTRGITDSSSYIRLHSTSSARVIIPFEVKSWEECRYRNGYMVYYKGLREVNGREKMNRQISRSGRGYLINDASGGIYLDTDGITNNVMMLYYEEPVNRQKVFSEALKRWVPLYKTGTHSYQLILDGGNYNEYFYENRLCSKVKVHTGLFNAIFLKVN